MKPISKEMMMILKTVANKTMLFINNYFMDQKYKRVSITAFKYYSKAIADYSAEILFEKKNDPIIFLTTYSTIDAIR